jgi:hypothetical protein
MARRDIIASHFREPKFTNDALGLLGIEPPVITPVPTEPQRTIAVETEDRAESFDIPIHEED